MHSEVIVPHRQTPPPKFSDAPLSPFEVDQLDPEIRALYERDGDAYSARWSIDAAAGLKEWVARPPAWHRRQWRRFWQSAPVRIRRRLAIYQARGRAAALGRRTGGMRRRRSLRGRSCVSRRSSRPSAATDGDGGDDGPPVEHPPASSSSFPSLPLFPRSMLGGFR
jgi:hypothetical protein